MPDLKIPKKIPHTIYLPEKESNYITNLATEKECTKSQLFEALINYYIATKDSKSVKKMFSTLESGAKTLVEGMKNYEKK